MNGDDIAGLCCLAVLFLHTADPTGGRRLHQPVGSRSSVSWSSRVKRGRRRIVLFIATYLVGVTDELANVEALAQPQRRAPEFDVLDVNQRGPCRAMARE